MMATIVTFLMAFVAFNANAALFETDKAFIKNVNLIKNPGFESGRAKWTASGGTLSTATSGSDLLQGNVSATWDSDGAAQTLSHEAIAFPNAMKGKNGVFYCDIRGTTSLGTHLIEVTDGTNTLASTTIVGSTDPVRNYVNFVFSTTGGNVVPRIKSVAANEPQISIDNCYIGPAEGVTTGLTTTQDIFSFRGDNASPVVVSNENVDFVSGNCTRTGTGQYTCTFNTNFFSAAPNCVCNTLDAGTTGVCRNTATASSVDIVTLDNSGTVANRAFQMFCQKAGADSPQVGYKPEVAAQSWSGYHDNTCSLARTNTAYGDPTADATCALTERTNRNFGTVSTYASGGNALPGITFTPKQAGRYLVCASVSALGATSGADAALKLWDGTTTIAERDWDVPGTSLQSSIQLCGIYVVSTVASTTLSIQLKSSTGALTIQALTGASAIEWSLAFIDQSFPMPTLAAAITAYGDTGLIRVVGAKVDSNTPGTITNQYGDWLSSVTRNGNGDVTQTIKSGVFTVAPSCNCTAEDTGIAQNCMIDTTSATSTTLVRTQLSNTADAGVDHPYNIICIGR